MNKIQALYIHCLCKIAELLKESYWSPDLPRDQNPFRHLPCSIVDQLTLTLILASYDGTLSSSDLRLLITSDRVSRLVLELSYIIGAPKMDTTNFERMLRDLSTSCRYLTEIAFEVDESFNESKIRLAFHQLLTNASELKSIGTSVKIDLHSLHNCSHLEDLSLSYKVEHEIVDMLKVDGQFKVNATLKRLALYHEICDYLDLAVILTFCTELQDISQDVSGCMVHLHLKELQSGALKRKYKLRKCKLGDQLEETEEEVFPTAEGVRITALTCPDLRAVEMLVSDDQVLPGLIECERLASLDITWSSTGEYDAGLRPLLSKGHFVCNFKVLSFRGCDNVDIPSIGACCFNLEELGISYCSYNICTLKSFSRNSFAKLRICRLYDEFDRNGNQILFGILSRAANLELLKVHFPGSSADRLLNDILMVNRLPKLNNLQLLSSGLSPDGWKNLCSSVSSLKAIEVEESDLDFNDISTIVKECNESIICSST